MHQYFFLFETQQTWNNKEWVYLPPWSMAPAGSWCRSLSCRWSERRWWEPSKTQLQTSPSQRLDIESILFQQSGSTPAAPIPAKVMEKKENCYTVLDLIHLFKVKERHHCHSHEPFDKLNWNAALAKYWSNKKENTKLVLLWQSITKGKASYLLLNLQLLWSHTYSDFTASSQKDWLL